jgi:hypothetical protein
MNFNRPDNIPQNQWETLSPAMKRRMALSRQSFILSNAGIVVTDERRIVMAIVVKDGDSFDQFIHDLPIIWDRRIAGSLADCGRLLCFRVSDDSDLQGCTFNGVIYLNDITGAPSLALRHTIHPLNMEAVESA